jgi:hypothetical protein
MLASEVEVGLGNVPLRPRVKDPSWRAAACVRRDLAEGHAEPVAESRQSRLIELATCVPVILHVVV